MTKPVDPRVCIHERRRRVETCETCDLADELAAAEETIAELRTLLSSVQWGYNAEAGCPSCHALAVDGMHFDGCEVAKALAP